MYEGGILLKDRAEQTLAHDAGTDDANRHALLRHWFTRFVDVASEVARIPGRRQGDIVSAYPFDGNTCSMGRRHRLAGRAERRTVSP
jgi:hypothetical protein